MEIGRKPFQGVVNIIRFNWHFYLIAGVSIVAILAFQPILPEIIQPIVLSLLVLVILSIAISLLVSFYVYDISNFYQLHWLPNLNHKSVLNISAGFDETSAIMQSQFKNSKIAVCDFYNPIKHKEVSILRARKIYPALNGTINVSTAELPFEDNFFDFSITILSAHEIRDIKERVIFFRELRRVTKPSGIIYVTEHLRDFNNFFAFNVGFFHFYSRRAWNETFKLANLLVRDEIKITPFITTFIINKNGDTL